MLVSCNPKCKRSDGRTEGSLDISTDEVICRLCGDSIGGISSFTKQSMKNNKDVINSTKKAFMFDCKNCHKKVETEIINGTAYGKNCRDKNCMINISEIMANAIQKISEQKENKEAE